MTMDRTLVLQLAPVGTHADAVLASEFDAIRWWCLDRPNEWLNAHAGQVRALVTTVRHGCDGTWFDELPALGAVCSWGAGFDTLDVRGADARGIQVSNTPDVLDECVADLAWALLLGVARQTAVADRYVRDGHWQRLGEFPLARRVWGTRLGVLGMGRIGSAVARRATGFGMEIRYCTRRHRPEVPSRYEASLKALAVWCDYLVIACAGGPATRHLVDSAILDALGPEGVLVNVARGSVVDQKALENALLSGRLGGAGLDVIDGEPGVPANLRGRDNVLVTPHIGSATHQTRRAMEAQLVDNLRHFIGTGSVLNPVGTVHHRNDRLRDTVP